ncbi:hypothetical protein MKW94_009055 [Papaver nudicaule]|uniref:Senescence regulator n=1 Tax=Papaver nudicaule TaxID=74823 RepID=A0AA42B3P5_PAPNU|nr:hypothetical protein [Papaver nudicaule]
MEELFNNNNNTNSSTIRFLGILKQPTTTTNNHHPSPPPPDSFPFELDESDVIWSSSSPSASSSPDLPKTTTDFIVTESNSSPRTESTLSSSSPRNSFRNDKFGLTAALSEDNIHANNHLQRKRSLNSPLSAASTAVRMIPPIPIQRSSFGSGGGGGSGSGGGGGSFLGPSSLGKYPYNQSAPVNVPVWPNRNHRSGSGGNKKVFYDENDDDDDDESYAEMLPPHEIVARSHLTTFSVFEGVGRTLKGRDLRRVRTAVMQKTGFLD